MCLRCGDKLHRDETAVKLSQKLVELPELTPPWLHVACAIDVNPEEACSLFTRISLGFEGREQLVERAQLRVQARAEGVKIKDPDELKTFCASADRARDPSGRPRVRVLIHHRTLGPAFAGHGLPVKPPGFGVPLNTKIVTRHNEYVLEGLERVRPIRYIVKPDQPLVAAVVVCSNDTHLRFEESSVWVNGRIGPPILWANCHTKNIEWREHLLLGLRQRVDSAGYVGDESLTLVSSAVTNAALVELGELLDAHVANDYWSSLGLATIERATQLLERQVAHDNKTSISTCFDLLRGVLATAPRPVRQRLAVASSATLRMPSVRNEALAFLRMLDQRVDPAPLMREVAQALAARHLPLNERFSVMGNALIFSGHGDPLIRVLKDTLLYENNLKENARILDNLIETATRRVG